MITVQNVNKYYGSLWAAKNLNFSIDEGECIGFLGLNGAGKSTTLRMLSCLTLPTSGRISVRGFDVEDNPHEIRKFIGYLPETPPLYPEMTVKEFIQFAGKLRGLTSAELAERMPEVLKTCGLSSVANQVIGTLSHGYKQRVGIAQAIVHRPALLILDEPIKGLDPVQIVEMREMIRSLRGKHTILLSSHILSEIEKTCDRILMIHHGALAGEGTEDELASKFASEYRMELEVVGNEADAKAAIARLEDAKDCEIHPMGDRLRIRISVPHTRRSALSRAIVNANLGLVGMHTISSGLETAFIQMSRQSDTSTPSHHSRASHDAKTDHAEQTQGDNHA